MELAIGLHPMPRPGRTELNLSPAVGSPPTRPTSVFGAARSYDTLAGKLERCPMVPGDAEVVTSVPERPVGLQQREPTLNGCCCARHHFSPEEDVERSFTAAAELRGKGWAWT
jgi:hypothetical protein